MLLLGFAAGLPLLLALSTLGFRLREAGIELDAIGYASWVGLVYGFKWSWSPLVDRLPLPGLTTTLGQRRGWLLLAQLLVAGGLVGLALTDPRQALGRVVWLALLVAFASATQDIALDAYRIESAEANRQGILAATYQTGYRLAMLWGSAGALWMAARYGSPDGYSPAGWRVAYLTMAASMLVGVVTVLWSREPAISRPPAAQRLIPWLRQALVAPFTDFWHRYRWQALLTLTLIATYRLSDTVVAVMVNPFYVDAGYRKAHIALVSYTYGTGMTLTGTFLGGALVARWGLERVLLLGAVLSAGTNLLFAALSLVGPHLPALALVISAEYLATGLAAAAFVAYLSSLTNLGYSATQYALLSSLMLLLPKWAAGFAGKAVATLGYTKFFVGTALLGIPAVGLALVILWLGRAQRPHPESGGTAR
ncbi:MAG: AmpG family muropeptide MFS transporter [Chloracidobacterium sp.]|uniref:AmpG family muropeptide MFS transporter n=2 Tax=Chloracidobacterium validum TaxID=2821543 RepID=A0ABX8B904_9BACT|nr:AmpG family muropeptide MFS transporter [Chloracidobacterium validum]QUW02927.1 AmpG family muropeptide MFS transporter [Chloracidobacterium validum]